ncbi:MAG: MBL fold metallo-hydrolase [Gemmatimonadota bacterium]|nr:MBL fold metallo-hydrolase [Gemmatimonadota bacterium]
MKLTFLGTGTSFGVPQVGCRCAVCRSADPRDQRSRTGALVVTNGGSHILIDTPPELRLQLLAAKVDRVDAVLYTHDHADHTHGIDDLRAVSVRSGVAIPVYGSRETLDSLRQKFGYIFDDAVRPVPGTSKPEAQLRVLAEGERVTIGDIELSAVAVPHGPASVYAYRIGPLAYVTDAKMLPPAALAALAGAQVLVLNALFRSEHPTHLSVPEAVRIAQQLGAARTFLTHLTHEFRHADLLSELPSGVAPAYDGLTIEFD